MLYFRMLCLCVAMIIVHTTQGNQVNFMPDYVLQDFLSRIQERDQFPNDYLEQQLSNNAFQDVNDNYRVRKDLPGADLYEHLRMQTRDDILLAHEPQPRKESLEHSLLYGHQYMQGGAGEGQQHLKPDGSIDNMQVIKSDSVLPAYCNPPNPCPLGYTNEDGCLETFENTAKFSKEYQADQDCMCDSEHMFNCLGNGNENELDVLSRSIQNEGAMDNTLDKIIETMDDKAQHKVVAKKFFTKRSTPARAKRSLASVNYHYNGKMKKNHLVCTGAKCIKNPFLTGEKLPVVAKKSPHTAKL